MHASAGPCVQGQCDQVSPEAEARAAPLVCPDRRCSAVRMPYRQCQVVTVITDRRAAPPQHGSVLSGSVTRFLESSFHPGRTRWSCVDARLQCPDNPPRSYEKHVCLHAAVGGGDPGLDRRAGDPAGVLGRNPRPGRGDERPSGDGEDPRAAIDRVVITAPTTRSTSCGSAMSRPHPEDRPWRRGHLSVRVATKGAR
jgi:hypothetical protein